MVSAVEKNKTKEEMEWVCNFKWDGQGSLH